MAEQDDAPSQAPEMPSVRMLFPDLSDCQQLGHGFAFPSQTLYMGRDDGLDRELGETAKQEVESLRGSGKLPFPRLSAERMGQLEGTLDYPPRGSVDAHDYAGRESEPLSIEPKLGEAKRARQEVEGER